MESSSNPNLVINFQEEKNSNKLKSNIQRETMIVNFSTTLKMHLAQLPMQIYQYFTDLSEVLYKM